MGELLALKAWYCDSHASLLHDRRGTAAIVQSAGAKRPAGNPKADLGRYFMLAHGSHLVDTARYLGGEIVEVDARRRERFGAFCWFVDVTFASGALGHLDLTVPVRMDWHEGFQIYGQNGSVLGRTYNPWLLQIERRRHLPRSDGRQRLGSSAPTDTSIAGSSKASPRRFSIARRCAGQTSRTVSPRCGRWSRSPDPRGPASLSVSPTSRGLCDQDRDLRQDVCRNDADGRPSSRAPGRL